MVERRAEERFGMVFDRAKGTTITMTTVFATFPVARLIIHWDFGPDALSVNSFCQPELVILEISDGLRSSFKRPRVERKPIEHI